MSNKMKNFQCFANRAIVHIKELIDKNELIIPYKIEPEVIDEKYDLSGHEFEIEDEFGLNEWKIDKYIDYNNVVICHLFIVKHNINANTKDWCYVYIKNLDKHFTKTNDYTKGEYKDTITIDDFIFKDYTKEEYITRKPLTHKRIR